jgi:hypothetical protein
MTLNSTGLGVGRTPSAWSSIYKGLVVGGTSGNTIVLAGNDASIGTGYYLSAAGIYNRDNGSATVSSINMYNRAFVFRTAASGTVDSAITWTDSMTLDASGNLLVGVASGTLSRITSSFLSSSGNVGIKLIDSQSNNTAKFADFFNGTGTLGSITNNNNAGVLYNVTSDKRLKENISDSESASSLIDSLQVRQFDWKVNNSHQRYGFIAQELVTVVPEAVYQPTKADEMMAVDYSKLVPMLIKEIQSLRTRVQTLEAR